MYSRRHMKPSWKYIYMYIYSVQGYSEGDFAIQKVILKSISLLMHTNVHRQSLTLRSLMSSATMEVGLVRLKHTMIRLACCSMMLMLLDTQVRRARKLSVERMF